MLRYVLYPGKPSWSQHLAHRGCTRLLKAAAGCPQLVLRVPCSSCMYNGSKRATLTRGPGHAQIEAGFPGGILQASSASKLNNFNVFEALLSCISAPAPGINADCGLLIARLSELHATLYPAQHAACCAENTSSQIYRGICEMDDSQSCSCTALALYLCMLCVPRAAVMVCRECTSVNVLPKQFESLRIEWGCICIIPAYCRIGGNVYCIASSQRTCTLAVFYGGSFDCMAC